MLSDIHFHDAEGLAEKLKENSISDFTALRHFIIYTILFASTYQIPIVIIDGSESEEQISYYWELGYYVVSAIINYYGLMHLYQISQCGDDENFFKRYCCLSLPVNVRVLPMYICVVVICSLIFILLELKFITESEKILTILIYLAGIVYQLYFYRLMRKFIRFASGQIIE